MDIYRKLLELQQAGTPAALVTVINTRGSVPRESGSKMIVEQGGAIHGTIGGSAVEGLVIEAARDCIREGKPRIVQHDLADAEGKDTGMVCGGHMEFFIEPLAAADNLYIFGGGHVGFHLARFAAMTGFSVTIIDDRESFASRERFPQARECLVGDPADVAAQLPLRKTDYIVIVTRGHQHDYEVLRETIRRPHRYLGMIGSKTKRRQIYDRLQKDDGLSENELKNVYSPIGLEIGAETPEEIAVSILAELIRIRRTGNSNIGK